MKLLLTSAGISNDTISAALARLIGKKPGDVRVGFVVTAKSYREGDITELLENQLTPIKERGYTNVTLVDPSTDSQWRDILDACDVVFLGGGNTFYLLKQSRASGLDLWLAENLDEKIYVGISAGSVLMTPSVAIAAIDEGDEDLWETHDKHGLHFVDFEISPHTPEDVSHEANEQYAITIPNELYACDDQTAIKVVDGKIEVVSEGKWKKYN